MKTDCQFWWNWWVNFGIAITTFLAVLVALFRDNIIARLFPSKLLISLRKSTGEKTKVHFNVINEKGEQVQRTEDARYYHIRVSNQARWPRSNQTQVFLQRVEQPGPDGALQIKWDGEVPIEWTHQAIYPLARTIGPDANCDLCSVGKGKWIRLHPVIAPNSLTIIYQTKIVLVLTLQAKGNEGESPIARFKIAWDGNWEDGDIEMASHLVVKDITGEANI